MGYHDARRAAIAAVEREAESWPETAALREAEALAAYAEGEFDALGDDGPIEERRAAFLERAHARREAEVAARNLRVAIDREVNRRCHPADYGWW
jgi:hypothetical protein